MANHYSVIRNLDGDNILILQCTLNLNKEEEMKNHFKTVRELASRHKLTPIPEGDIPDGEVSDPASQTTNENKPQNG